MSMDEAELLEMTASRSELLKAYAGFLWSAAVDPERYAGLSSEGGLEAMDAEARETLGSQALAILIMARSLRKQFMEMVEDCVAEGDLPSASLQPSLEAALRGSVLALSRGVMPGDPEEREIA